MKIKPLVCYQPETVGIPPKERYGHCLHYLKSTKMLAVYGGRNDTLYGTYGSCCLRDIKVLDLKYMAWCKVKIGGALP